MPPIPTSLASHSTLLKLTAQCRFFRLTFLIISQSLDLFLYCFMQQSSVELLLCATGLQEDDSTAH